METNCKKCLMCDKQIRGRVDKKFCNDYCRNAYNNQLKSPINNRVRNTNNLLGKNRRILESVIEKNKVIKIKKEVLLQMGYCFKYNTHFYQTKKSLVIGFCYDYCIFSLNEEWSIVMKTTD
jgi:hypothetical protein